MRKKDDDKGGDVCDVTSSKDSADGKPIKKSSQGNVAKGLAKQRKEEMRRRQTRWLVYNHVPHHTTQSEEFIDMMTLNNPDFQPIARETFHQCVDDMFEKMVASI